MRTSLAVVLTVIAACILFAQPAAAAPPAQASVPSFSLSADATLTVTVVLSDGQTVVVPIAVQVEADHQNGATQVTLVTDAVAPAGVQVTVESPLPVAGTLQVTPPAAVLVPTATPQPDADASREPMTYVVALAGNLRSGPGISYPIVGTVEAGEEVVVVGQNEDGSWLQLADGAWLAAFLVTPAGEPAQAPQETVTPPPAPTALPTVAATAVDAAAETLEELAASNSELVAALAALADLLAAPRPRSPAWRAEVTAQAAIVLENLETLGELPAIPGYEDLQAQVVATVEVCTEAAGYMATGLETLTPAELVAATQAITACSTQAAALAATVEQLQP